MRNYIFILTIFLLFFSEAIISQSITKPDIFKFGDTKSNIMMAINEECKIVNDKKISPVQLPTAKTSQSRVDCERFKYAGKKRNIELIFADDILDMVLILIEPEEEDTLIAGFTKLYGKPAYVTDNVTFFLNNGVAVRNNPHEVLFVSDRLKPSYKVWLEQKDK